MFRGKQRIAQCNIELFVVDIVQEHVDAAKIVGGNIDLLPIESLTHILFAEHFGEFQQQRTAAAGRIVHFVHLFFADERNTGKEFGDLLWREKLAARFSRIAGIHRHQKLVGVAEGVDLIIGQIAEFHVADLIENLHQRLIAFLHCRSEFVAVYIDVGKQALHVILARCTLGRVFDGMENIIQRFVQIGVCCGAFAHIAEELRRKDIESPLLYGHFTSELGLLVRTFGIIKVRVPGPVLFRIDKSGNILGDEAVKQHSQDIIFEIPTINTSSQVVSYLPDCAVKFRTLLFSCHILSVYQFLNIHFQQLCNTNHRIQLRLRRVGTPLRYGRRVFAQLFRQPFPCFILFRKNNSQPVNFFHSYYKLGLQTKILKIIQSPWIFM